MKRVSLVVMDAHREASLKTLRELGTVHLEQRVVVSDRLTELLEEKTKVEKILATLNEYAAKLKAQKKAAPQIEAPAGGSLRERAAAIMSQVNDLELERKALAEKLASLSIEQGRFTGWGDFNPRDLQFLKDCGTEIRLYELAEVSFKSLPKELNYIVLQKSKMLFRIATVGGEIPGETPLVLGGHSLSELNAFVAEAQKREGEIEGRFEALSSLKGTLEEERDSLGVQIEFETARAGMDALEDAPATTSVAWVSGYAPVEAADALKGAAKANGWALILTDPSESHSPPTLLKNSPLVRITKPVFDFLGTVPGYREYDISSSFLVFFSVFFAMIFGDAAYGLLILAGAIAVAVKSSKAGGKTPDIVKLLFLMAGATIVWGGVNGAWFAIPHESLPPFLVALIIPHFNSIGPPVEFPLFMQSVFNLPQYPPTGELKTRWSIQFFCFSLALIHILLARVSRIKKELPSLSAVSHVGWGMVVFALYLLVLNMLLGIPMQDFVVPMIGIGMGIVFVFSDQNGGNFFKNILKNLGNFFQLFLKAVGCFGDIISYIRLFAVGLAGGMIAYNFNTMAIPEGGLGEGATFVIRLVAAVLILVLGHGLNLALTALAVIVHGVRLNLLEFAGNHLEMEWSGYEYKPFALKQKLKQ
ncbi:MAG: hypothetical protein FWG66_02420 [Spirochaetes bacterium]|nr:hypothetical protein [Spirochaetota bacterium]